MKTYKKVLLGVLAFAVIFIISFVTYINASYEMTFDIPYPEVNVTSDSATIARGEYLVYGPAHCASCHVSKADLERVDEGEKVPLQGGFSINIDPGSFTARNLTPDKETGIGNRTDGEIARMMRYQVNHKGEAVFPFMPFGNMAQDDLDAVISFLRSQEPVTHELPETEYSFIGKMVMRFMIRPAYPLAKELETIPRDSTIAYGKYLCYDVANCYGCHTNRDLKTGAFIGEPFAGGFTIPSEIDKTKLYVAPNLTPDAETGVMAEWSETAFINRMRGGRVHKGSPMPWGPFSRMDELDLKAVYRFLQSIEPVKLAVEETVIDI